MKRTFCGGDTIYETGKKYWVDEDEAIELNSCKSCDILDDQTRRLAEDDEDNDPDEDEDVEDDSDPDDEADEDDDEDEDDEPLIETASIDRSVKRKVATSLCPYCSGTRRGRGYAHRPDCVMKGGKKADDGDN